MRNPRVLTDEVVDKIEELLRSYDTALENILYKHFNTTAEQKKIREVLRVVDAARHGETDEELQRSFDEFQRFGGH